MNKKTMTFGGDKRATQMATNPQRYFEQARERAREEAAAAIRRERELKKRDKH